MYAFPSLTDCLQSARAAFRAALPGADAWVWPNNIGPSAKVVGGAQWLVYQRLDYVGRQAFALFAEGKYLDDHGAELNLPRKLASAASGNVAIIVSGPAAFAVGGAFARFDGMAFVATAAVSSVSAGVLLVPVLGPAGASSTTQAGAPMTILSGLTGAGATGATATVDGNGLAGGADIEPDGAPQTRDLSTYRGRILFRKANPPQGGSPADYVQWASAVAGVTRVYVERVYAGPGSVRIFPIFDTLFASTGGVPDSAHVILVANALAPLQPAAAVVTVAAAVAQPIAVAVSNLMPSTTAAQAAVVAELADTFQRLGRVAGGDVPVASMPYLATRFTFQGLWIEQAIANAPGVVSADCVAPDTLIAAGAIPVLGAVTFT
jgi:uncharacterized phage protein gp47/JayE